MLLAGGQMAVGTRLPPPSLGSRLRAEVLVGELLSPPAPGAVLQSWLQKPFSLLILFQEAWLLFSR